MNIKNKENVLFDLDGTLTDPKEGITKAVAYALKYYGIKVEKLEDLTSFIGPPLIESFMTVYGFSAEQASEAVQKYREYFAPIGINQNAGYNGIEDLLKALKAAGKHLYVATSKPTGFAKTVLENFGFTSYFSGIIGASEDSSFVKKADIIKYCLSKYNISAQNAVMVGDRKHDILGAKANDVVSIGVLYGYGSREELIQNGATYLAKDIKELTNLLI